MLRQFSQWRNETSNKPEHLARSYLFLRKSVGVIGIATPLVLVIGTMILGNSFVIKDSISSYYYTVTKNIFVGSMCAVAIFLICYRYEHLDDFVSTVAGVSAIGVALFPTTPDNATGLQVAIGWAHGSFAVCFLGSLAFMALIFRKSVPKPSDEKKQRNKVYKWCSITIFICVGLLILIAFIQNLILSGPLLPSLHPILVLEWLALWAFGFAWFVKGETIWKDPPKEGIPAPGGVWNSKTRVVASTLGILAGLLGVIHGIFEIIQGNVAPSGVFMLAVGPPCQANRVWHQCFPAITIIPNFFVTGVLAIIVSLLIFLWAAVFVQSKNGGLILILLSIIQLLVGGGFISPELGIIAGVVGTRIKVPFTWWRVQLSDRSQRRLEKGWPWFLFAFVFVLAAYVILGSLFNEFLLSLALLPLFFALGLLLLAILTVLTILSGFAYDIQRQTNSQQAPTAGELPQPQDQVISYGQLLQYERELLDWTQEQLTEKIGVDVSVIQSWETNRFVPDRDFRRKLAEHLGNDFYLSSKVLPNRELQVSVVQFELTAQDFSSIISALTKLHTQSWLIQQGRYEDLIVYTDTQDTRVAQEANLVISNLSYNSPALITIITDPHFVTTTVTTTVTLAVALQKVIDAITEARHKLKKTDQDLEKEQIDIDLKKLELKKKQMDYAFEIARHHVNELCSVCDPQEKATMVQTLVPNISETLIGK